MHSIYRKKNTATTIYLYLGNSSTYYSGFEPRTGRTPLCYVSIDGGTPYYTDATVTELSSSYLPGVYKVVLAAGATNGDIIVCNLLDSTGAGYRSLPMTIYTDIADVPATAPTTAFEGKIDAIDNYIDTEVAAILVDTGTTLQANHTAIETIVAANSTLITQVRDAIVTELADVLTDTGTTIPATITTLTNKVDTIDGIVDSILADTAVLGATPIAANVTQVGGSADAATNLSTSANAMKIGLVHNSTAPTASSFLSDTGTLSSQNDAYNNRLIVMTSGALVGAVAEIADYVGATKTFTFTSPLPAAPANNDTFIII